MLLLAQFLPPIVGGTEQHVWALATALAARGHQVTLMGFQSAGTEPTESVSQGIRIIRVRSTANLLPSLTRKSARPYALPMADPVVVPAIARELSRYPYDVIHAHNWIVNSALGPASKHGVPIVMTLHDYGQICATFGLMHRGADVCIEASPARCVPCATSHYGRLRGPATVAANALYARRRSKGITRFIAVSKSVSTAVEGGWPSRGVQAQVIPNFIPDDLIVEEVRPADSDGPLVFVGTVSRNKGIETLLEAYELLDDPPPLLLVGHVDPDHRYRFASGVTPLGELPRSAVLEIVNSARAVVIPSLWQDPCPTVVLEAMAAGRPVVAAASGGIPELVDDGVSGILVQPANASALAAAIQRVLSDEPRARALGIAGRDRARDFTATSVVGRIEHVYADAIAEFATSP